MGATGSKNGFCAATADGAMASGHVAAPIQQASPRAHWHAHAGDFAREFASDTHSTIDESSEASDRHVNVTVDLPNGCGDEIRISGTDGVTKIIKADNSGIVRTMREEDEAIARAERGIAELSDEFKRQAITRVAAMRFAIEQILNGALQPLTSRRLIGPCNELQVIHHGAADLYQVAATYGLSLVSDIARSLRDLSADAEVSAARLRAIDGHIMLLEIVLREGLDGNNTEPRPSIEEILARLQVIGGWQAQREKDEDSSLTAECVASPERLPN